MATSTRSPVLALVTLSLILASSPRVATGANRLVRETLPRVVTLSVHDEAGDRVGQGSGFCIGNGEIVTNLHVVAGATWVEVYDQGGDLLGTAPFAVLSDIDNDLAVLSIPGLNQEGLSIASSAPEAGEDIWVFGAPMGLEGTVSTGIVSALRDTDGRPRLQITAPISPGSSGGPVVNGDGEVLGVVVAMLSEGQNLNFAVPTGELRRLLQQERSRTPFPDPMLLDEEFAAAFESALQVVAAFVTADTVAIGRDYSGRLDAEDLDLDGPTDIYTFIAPPNTPVDVRVNSSDFDTMLQIIRDEGMYSDDEWRAGDDDGGEGTNSRLTGTLPAAGTYHIMVQAYGAGRGRYTLSLDEHRSEPERDPPLADRWVRFSFVDGAPIYYDTASLEMSSRYATVWTPQIFDEVQYDDDGLRYDRVIMKCRINCRDRKICMQYADKRHGNDTVSGGDVPTYLQEWTSIIPGTIGESLMDVVCR